MTECEKLCHSERGEKTSAERPTPVLKKVSLLDFICTQAAFNNYNLRLCHDRPNRPCLSLERELQSKRTAGLLAVQVLTFQLAPQ